MTLRQDPRVSLRAVAATRYVTPLREGGSLPGLVEGDDDGLYVAKFRGAGQGPRALVAEVIVGELARSLGLPVPELVALGLDEAIGRAEPDPEIQDLLSASTGVNLGVDFLPGALPYAPGAGLQPSPELAADVVWLDALTTNVDRTPRNPNLLVWHGRVWLIDHGAALYRQHGEDAVARAREPFGPIVDHVLLGRAGSVLEADERLAPRVSGELLARLAGLVPEDWGVDASMYAQELAARLQPPRTFAQEAERARA